VEKSKVRDIRDLAGAVGLGTTLFFLAFLSPVIYSGDGLSMLAVAESLVTQHSFAVPKSLGIPGVGGLYYSKWYPLLSVLAVPFVGVGTIVARLTHMPVHYTVGAFALILQPILVGGTTALVVMLSSRLGSSRRGSVLAAIGFAFGTVALVYAREFFADPLLALITVAAIYLELGSNRERFGVGPLAALAVLAKPTGAILGPILGLHAALKERSLKPMLLPLLGTATGILVYFAYNHLRFGGALRFNRPLIFSLSKLPGGLAGQLLSPWRGLIWYCPAVLALAGLSGRIFRRLDVLLIVSTTLAYLFLYSMREWTGGWSWGPRYLVPALPGLMALCGLLESRSRMALILLTTLGFLVNAPTLVSYYERIYQEDFLAQRDPATMHWSFGEAPFVRIWGSMTKEITDAQHTDVGSLVRQAGQPENTPDSWRTLRIVPVWWWMLPAVGVPRLFGAAIAALIASMGVLLIVWALLNTREIVLTRTTSAADPQKPQRTPQSGP
jgi:hypothetical protein